MQYRSISGCEPGSQEQNWGGHKSATLVTKYLPLQTFSYKNEPNFLVKLARILDSGNKKNFSAKK